MAHHVRGIPFLVLLHSSGGSQHLQLRPPAKTLHNPAQYTREAFAATLTVLPVDLPFACNHAPPFQQESRQSVDHWRAPRHQTLGYSVNRLEIELILALDWHKPHSESLHGSRNGFGIGGIVLVRLQKRRTNWAGIKRDFMALLAESPCEAVRTAADAHETSRQARHKR